MHTFSLIRIRIKDTEQVQKTWRGDALFITLFWASRSAAPVPCTKTTESHNSHYGTAHLAKPLSRAGTYTRSFLIGNIAVYNITR